MDSIVKKAQVFAIGKHDETNHFYEGELPYSYHLDLAFHVGLKFIYLVDKNEQENVLAAIWCHDVIEDCRVTYNDLKKETNQKVAELVYAVTNEKGKNRAERANSKYYDGIVHTKYATFIKLCDRISHVLHANKSSDIGFKDSMVGKYRSENKHFLLTLAPLVS